jgi:glycosyltransferase involved in cell wall biosynthesis
LPKLKITIVQGPFLPVPTLLGGAVEKAWFELGIFFKQKGHQVIHFSREFPGLPNTETIEGVKHVRIPSFDAPTNPILFRIYDLIYAVRVLRNLPSADIIVTNDVILPILLRKKRYGKLYIHAARQPKGQMFLYNHADRIQGVSSSVIEEIRKELPNHNNLLKVIPYFIPSGHYLKNFQESFPEKENIVLYTGRIHKEKGLKLLLKAWYKLAPALKHDWQLRIIGPWKASEGGSGEGFLQELKLISRYDPSVKFSPPIFDNDKLQLEYRKAKIFVYPSLATKGETFGLSILEAMANGCAPIVSNLDCFRDFIEPDKSGIIFEHRAPEIKQELTTKIKNLMNTPDKISELAQKAYLKSKEFSLEKVGNQYLSDFKELISE